jgi:hypothetical protein
MNDTHRTPTRYSLALVSAVIWTALILGLYYWVHKPLTPALARALGGAVLDLAVALIFVVVGGGLGRRLLRPLDLSIWSALERTGAAALIGLGLHALLILVVGAVMLNTLSMAALLLVVGVIVRRDVAAWVRDLVIWARGGLATFPAQTWTRFLASTALVLVIFALVMATLPPTKWDVLTYHLAGAEQYVERGHFYAVPHNHFLGFPQGTDALFAGQLALTGRLAGGGVLHWGIGVLMLLLTGGYTARHAGPAAGCLAVLVLLVSRTIWLEMTFAYVDLMLMGLIMVALAAFDVWDAPDAPQTHPIKMLVFLGAVAGLALGTKYTAFWIALAVGLVIVSRSRKNGLLAVIRNGLIYGGVALLVALPWLVRNLIWYDNPVYPFFFESGEMDAIRQGWYSQPESGLIYGTNAWQIPIMPLMATFFGIEGAGMYASDVGPLFALLIPLLALAWGQITAPVRAVTRRALAVALIMTLGWIALAAVGSYINAQTRLVLYIFPPLAVVAGIALDGLRRLPEKPLNLGFIVQAMVGLVLVFTLIDTARILIRSGIHEYYSGEDDHEQEFLNYSLGWHAWAMEHLNELPAGSRVRFLWEPRTLYCDDDRITCRPDSLMDGWYYARRTVEDGGPAAIAAQWQTDGDPDYLLVYEFGRTFERDNSDLYTAADWAAWNTFVTAYLDRVWEGGGDEIEYILYRWR